MDHHLTEVSTQAVLLGWILLIGIPVLAAGAIIGRRNALVARLTAFSALAFQTFHTFEHIVQVIFWGKDPFSSPYMSPLAKQAALGLESIATTTFGLRPIPTLGMELLHLVGNTLFFLGVAALLVGAPFRRNRPMAKVAFTFEGLHLLEHMVLTYTAVSGSAAWGSSTLYNSLSGAQLSTHRIMWHFIMNLAALILTFAALSHPTLGRIKRGVIVAFLLSVNVVPILVAHFTVDAAAGFSSTIQLLSINTLLTLVLNPVTFTAIYLLTAPLSGAADVVDPSPVEADPHVEEASSSSEDDSVEHDSTR